MRTFYTFVLAGIAAVIAIFVTSFFFIDTAKHRTYYYAVNMDGYDVGSVKMERFITETKMVYKSSLYIPFLPALTESRIRLDLDRKHRILSYTREDAGNGARYVTAIESSGEGGLSYLSINKSLFSYAANMPVGKNTFLFEEDAPLLYLPIIENYDFRRGRAQAFIALVSLSPLLPPAKMFVTLTSINDEYIKVGKREIKTEHMLVKMRNYPHASIWVSKSDHSLVQLEIPKFQLRIKRIDAPRKFEPKEFEAKSAGYTSKEVEFKCGGARLAGTLTIPDKAAPRPAVLLVAGSGPDGRDCMGLFHSIADHLTKNGFCVLRYDPRGIGQSTGNPQATGDAEHAADCAAALEFLSSQKEVDAGKVSVIGHLDGAYYAAMAAGAEGANVNRIALMSPQFFPEKLYDTKFDLLKGLAGSYGWSDEYLKTAMRSILETIEKADAAKDGKAPILGYKCFAGKVAERARADSRRVISGLDMPVLIMQSTGEDPLNIDSSAALDETLTLDGKKRHMLVYFSYLGTWFGSKVNDGISRIRYSADSTALQSIRDWLGMDFTPEETPKTGIN